MNLLRLNYFDEIYLYRPVVDFRKGIVGLAGIVQNEMELSPFKKSLYLFSNRHHNKIKLYIGMLNNGELFRVLPFGIKF
jgi:transposase